MLSYCYYCHDYTKDINTGPKITKNKLITKQSVLSVTISQNITKFCQHKISMINADLLCKVQKRKLKM